MKKLLILAALATGVAACDLSTGTPAGPAPVRIVDSTGHPYGVYTIQGHPMPFTYTSAVTHTVLNSNLCLFTNGTYRFSELVETPSNLNPDAYYEYYDTYSLSSTGKVTFNGQSPGLRSIGTDTLTYFSAQSLHTYQFVPDSTQLNQSCLKPLSSTP